jgi:hypothetical protein
MPENPKTTGFIPWMIAGLIIGIAISLAVNIPTRTGWGFLGYLPWLAILLYGVINGTRQHRKFNRDLSDWSTRMTAYYAREMSKYWDT